MYLDKIKNLVQKSVDTKVALLQDSELLDKIEQLAGQCSLALKDGGKIIFCGNGGSFADAQHISAELTSRFLFDRPGLASLALGTNSSTMSAIGNDYGYENVFAREIQAIASPDDVLIAITTSGNSVNIIEALEAAKEANVASVVLTGASRGNLPHGIDVISVPSKDTARIQECHILIGHIICELVESDIFKDLAPSS